MKRNQIGALERNATKAAVVVGESPIIGKPLRNSCQLLPTDTVKFRRHVLLFTKTFLSYATINI